MKKTQEGHLPEIQGKKQTLKEKIKIHTTAAAGTFSWAPKPPPLKPATRALLHQPLTRSEMKTAVEVFLNHWHLQQPNGEEDTSAVEG